MTTSYLVGKRDAKLDVIPEEGAGVATPPPGAGNEQGEEPGKAEPQEEQETVVPVSISTEVRVEGEGDKTEVKVEGEGDKTEVKVEGEGEKMDISETSQMEQTEEPGEQVHDEL